MSNIGPTAPIPPSSAVPTYSPLGKPVVGNETPQEKDRALPPVVQGEAAEKSRNRIESKPEPERRDRHPDDTTESDSGEPAAEGEVAATAPIGNGVPAIRILPTAHADTAAGRTALDAFNQPAIDPGLLLDQHV